MITVSQALTRLARMRENTRNIGRPDAARVIVDTLLHEVNEPVVIEESPPIRILPFRINLADLFDPPLADDDRCSPLSMR